MRQAEPAPNPRRPFRLLRAYHRHLPAGDTEPGVPRVLVEAALEAGYTGAAWAVAGEQGLSFREERGQLAPLARTEAVRCLARNAPQRLGSAVAFPLWLGPAPAGVFILAPVEDSAELAEVAAVVEEVAIDLRRLCSAPARAKGEVEELATIAFDNAHEALMITDPEGRIQAVNPAFTRQMGWGREEVEGRRPGEVLSSDRQAPDLFARVFATVAREGRWEGVVCNRRRDGNYIIHQETIEEVRDANGRLTHYVATLADVTPLKEAELDMRRERDTAESALEALPGLFLFLDEQGRCRRSNRRVAAIRGRPPVALAEIVEEGSEPTMEAALATAFRDGEASAEARLRPAEGAAGTPHCFQLRALDLDGERLVCALGMDISRQHALAAELERLARTDHLTGCGTRQHGEEQIEHLLARLRREEMPFAVVLFDIDHFKRINDERGHSTGDGALVACVDYLRRHIREMDWLCRWGGEEFLLVLPGATPEAALETADRLRAGIAAAEPLEGERITVSAGVAPAQTGDDRDRLIARADEALYHAKRAGRDRVCTVEGGCRRTPA
ncbi:MAG: diguanylate cyclase [Thiohalospira sp.]